MITHEIGRVAGPAWLFFGILGYLWYRKRKGLPVWGSRTHDWTTQQIAILRDAGELELMDELLSSIRKRAGAVPEAKATIEGASIP
jgi:APA family basic amino acid/polyamine antiporter